MNQSLKFLFVFLFFNTFFMAFAQTARIQGVVLDENNLPVESVSVRFNETTGTSTNENGYYNLIVPANKKITVTFTHIILKKKQVTLILKTNEDYEFNFVMNANVEEIGEVILTADNQKRIEGITTI